MSHCRKRGADKNHGCIEKGKCMTVSCAIFGTLESGKDVFCWTLTNANGLQAQVLDYGVTIRSITVPDKNGYPVDVVLGYDTLEEYVADDAYLGATIGRFANRIRQAQFRLDGTLYTLYANDGENHLHGGKKGFNKFLWNSRREGDKVTFTRVSADGEEGYPGKLTVCVTIGWEGNSLCIRYEAQTDRDTILNLTNHSYFNLNGAGSGDVHGHMLQINAETFTENGKDCVPTGQIVPVAGTAMDFRAPKPIGRDGDMDDPCVRFFGGYDANFVISGHPAATVVGERTGIILVVDTDQPGMQLYTANVLTDRIGKQGLPYGWRSAFCLETQHFPDSIHHPKWPSCILRAGERFCSFTSYTFL